MKINKRFLVCLSLGFLLGMASVYANGDSEDRESAEIDYLGVAAVMIRDGNYERAEMSLAQVDTSVENFDFTRYYTISGLMNLRMGRYQLSVDNFEEALQTKQNDSVLAVYLAQAYFYNADYRETIDTIKKVPNINQYPDLLGLEAESFWRIGDESRAYAISDMAVGLFPSNSTIRQQRITYLIELDLSQEAALQAQDYIDHSDGSAESYVVMGEALRRGGITEEARDILEIGRLKYPGYLRINLSLAQCYLELGFPLTAGALIAESAALDSSLNYEAAEIFRQAGVNRRALFYNSQVPDEKKKTTQRFNILLGLESYEEALALEARMTRLGILDDDRMRYSMAYALYMVGRFDAAVGYLNRIDSAEYFTRGNQLRRAIETVKNQPVEYL